jgi:GNAT superfamily N-acetyltransferase
MQNVISIRKALRSDTEAAFRIRNKAILKECVNWYSNAQIQQWTKGKPSEKFADVVEESIYLALVDDEIATTGMIDMKTGKLDAIFTDPLHMGKGAAGTMLKYLEKIASRAGLKEIHLEATLNAASFYRKRGFIGEEMAMYISPRGIELECIPMAKIIDFA